MMMQPEHDLYCDEEHPPRQQCNDALAPPDVRAARIEAAVAAAETDAPQQAAPIVADEPASSAVREAVAGEEVPQPTVYVSREWERTADAVGGGHRDAAGAPEESGRGGLPRVAMALVAIAVVLVTVRRVRGRRGERR